MVLELTVATMPELNWINYHYDEIGFMRADLIDEQVVIAALRSHKVGLGKLVNLDEKSVELAGIYVLKPYRRQKIATQIIEHLLQKAEPSKAIYCIAFIHLVGFYKRLGFTGCTDTMVVPNILSERFKRCQLHYRGNVKLLVKKE